MKCTSVVQNLIFPRSVCGTSLEELNRINHTSNLFSSSLSTLINHIAASTRNLKHKTARPAIRVISPLLGRTQTCDPHFGWAAYQVFKAPSHCGRIHKFWPQELAGTRNHSYCSWTTLTPPPIAKTPRPRKQPPGPDTKATRSLRVLLSVTLTIYCIPF